MSRTRTMINIVAFLVLSALLVYLGATNLVFYEAQGSSLKAVFEDASGLLPRNDVTMRGVPVGSVRDVQLNEDGYALVTMGLQPGTEVPDGTQAEIVRRSPIGELTIELVPGDGEPLEDGATIAVSDTVPPPDVSRTIEVFADILHEVPSEELDILVTEVAKAVRGRSSDLARLSDAGAELPERLLQIEGVLESLIENSPELTGVFADNADVLADDITQTALLADILRDRRFDLVDLYRNGADFASVMGEILSEDKANLACMIRDFGDINYVLAKRHNLDNLAATLDKNHYFFGGANIAVRKDHNAWTWFRVQLLPHQEPAARQYEPHRPPPDVATADDCESRYGPGVKITDERLNLAPDSKFVRER